MKSLGNSQRASANSQRGSYAQKHAINRSTSSSKPTHSQTLNNSANPATVDAQRQELLVMTIDLGNGAKDSLRVFEGDDPLELAINFCAKHGLGLQLREPLAQNIYNNIEQVLNESVSTLNMRGGVSSKGSVPDMKPPEIVEQRPKEQEYARNSRETYDHLNNQNRNQEHLEYEEQQQISEYSDNQSRTNIQRNTDDTESYGEQYRGAQLYTNIDVSEKRGLDSDRFRHDDPEIYEMAEHEEHIEQNTNREAMMRSDGRDSPVGNGLSEKDLMNSKGDEENNQPEIVQRASNGLRQGYYTAIGRPQQTNPRRTENQQGVYLEKSWVSSPGFQNEEEYLDYLISSEYGGGNQKTVRGRQGQKFIPNINQTSRQMLEAKNQSSRGTVYDRLHNDAKMKHQQKVATPVAQSSRRSEMSGAKSPTANGNSLS